MSEQNIRPVTREEQLVYLIAFLEAQIANLQLDLDEARLELAKERGEEIVLSLNR